MSITTSGGNTTRAQAAPSRRVARRSRFYLLTALMLSLVVLIGFHHTFFLRPLFANRPLTPLAWTHGFVFSGWLLILIAQCIFVLRGRVRWHRRLGWFAAAYAAGMALLGAAVLIASEKRAMLGGDQSHAHSRLQFLLPFLGDMVLFGGLVAAGVLYRRRPEVHKRIMIMASVSLLDAAFGRFGYLFPFFDGLSTFWRAYGFTDLAALIILLADWRRCGRIHPAYAVCVALMMTWHAGLMAAGRSGVGLSLAGWIVA